MKGQKTRKNSFVLYHSYAKHLKRFSDEQVGKLMRCVFHYSETGEVLELDPLLEVAFDFIKEDIDINKDKYEETCKKNKENVEKRWNKDNAIVYERIRTGTNDTDNDNDNESDNDNEKDISKDIGDKSPDDFIERFQKWAKEKYPLSLQGVTDRKRVYNLKQILTPRKGKDGWMDKDPVLNFKNFIKSYYNYQPEKKYWVRSIYKFTDMAKLWREEEGKLENLNQEDRENVEYMNKYQKEHKYQKEKLQEYYK